MGRLDLDHLARQTMDDADLQRELLEIFQRQMAEKMAALTAPDAAVQALAHSIKGSARGVGAFDLALVAEALEQKAEADSAIIAEFTAVLDETMLEVGAFLSK